MEDEGGFWIGFMFRTPIPGLVSDRIVAAITRSHVVHVDALFVPPRPKTGGTQAAEIERQRSMRELFSTYMQETFKGYVPRSWESRNNRSHVMLLLRVEEGEYDRARGYIADLCSKMVPYNYSDLGMCCLPNSMAMGVASDVDPYPIPAALYCSQAMVLMLRHCIEPGRANAALLEALSSCSSRACSPNMLMRLLSHHCRRVDVGAYVERSEIVEYQPGETM